MRAIRNNRYTDWLKQVLFRKCILKCVGLPDSTVKAHRHNPAVTSLLLNEIWNWKQLGASIHDVICRLRPKTVPSGYTYKTWIPGTSI